MSKVLFTSAPIPVTANQTRSLSDPFLHPKYKHAYSRTLKNGMTHLSKIVNLLCQSHQRGIYFVESIVERLASVRENVNSSKINWNDQMKRRIMAKLEIFCMSCYVEYNLCKYVTRSPHPIFTYSCITF